MIHGKYSTYTNHHCRCTACRDAWNEYCRSLKARRAQSAIPKSVAHNAHTYSNWGCRCDVCTRDATRARREHYQATHAQRVDLWTPAELALVASEAYTVAELMAMTGRSKWAVVSKRSKLREARNAARAQELSGTAHSPERNTP